MEKIVRTLTGPFPRFTLLTLVTLCLTGGSLLEAGKAPGTAAVVPNNSTPASAASRLWSQPLRGSWVRQGTATSGDVVLADGNSGCEIVVSDEEHSAVRQAAVFLAADIEKISGHRPDIILKPSGTRVALRLVTLGMGDVPPRIVRDKLKGQWEAHRIFTTQDADAVWLVGANFRGTAFAAYTLSERLGIDPLYHWTGYTPEKHSPLVLKKTDYYAGPPSFKYRGLFHDDEDILPRPYDENGYTLMTGTVPRVWYERFFETALRLRMNQVAPYVRVRRPYEIQKTASEWGLFYTSHHYDTLLSNPWGYERFGLANARKAGTEWDWFGNKEGMIRFWRGGVLENRALDCIWPVGMRSTRDRGYKFPPNTTQDEKDKVFQEVIQTQVNLAQELLPKDKEPIFHFTLYGEMLKNYRAGTLELPPQVILVWDDNSDGIMRDLPAQLGGREHGVYYHLAYYGRTTKQTAHTVTPMRIAEQFRRIVEAGATSYVLVNVSELRDFVMGTRMIADISWDASHAFGSPHAAERFVRWWCREYFGNRAAEDAAEAYDYYYRILDAHDKIWYGSEKVQEALNALIDKFGGKPFRSVPPETLSDLQQRSALYREAIETVARASGKMTRPQRQFFYENVALGLLLDRRPTEAAIRLFEAVEEKDPENAWELCVKAGTALEKLEVEILRAERPPFKGWYAENWIRKRDLRYNVHRPYEQLRAFLSSGGRTTGTSP